MEDFAQLASDLRVSQKRFNLDFLEPLKQVWPLGANELLEFLGALSIAQEAFPMRLATSINQLEERRLR